MFSHLYASSCRKLAISMIIRTKFHIHQNVNKQEISNART